MPGANVYTSPNASNVNVPTTTETVIATVVVPAILGAGVAITLAGHTAFTTGTATTAVTFRLRRGGLTGTVVAAAEPDIAINAAGSTDPYGIQAVDTPPDSANLTYVLTAQQTAATGAGTAVVASLAAIVSQ